MKYFLGLVFLCFALMSFGQQTPVEEAQYQLQLIEGELQLLKQQLVEQGITPKQDYRYIELNGKVKAQKAKVKDLKKQAKAATKAANNPVTTLPPNRGSQPVTPTVSTDPLKQKKAELKDLKKRQKEMKTTLDAAGLNPTANQDYLDLANSIFAVEQEIDSFKTAAKQAKMANKQQPVSIQQPVYSPNTQESQVRSVVVDPVKAQKNKIKELRSRKKQIKQQVIAAGREPIGSQEMIDIENEITRANNELASLKAQAKNTTVGQPVITEPMRNEPVTFQTEKTPIVEAYQPPVIGLHTILFERYVTKLNPEYDEYINYVASQLRDNPLLRLEVASYTDNTEKNKISMQVTAAMAGNVRAAFMQRGIHPDRMIMKPQGSRKPIADNETILGQNRNRRVELSFAE